MSAEYKLVFRDRAGTKVHETMSFLELAYRRRVNEPGLLKFRLGGDHLFGREIIKDPRDVVDYQVEVWRRNAARGLDWYADFAGFYQSTVVETKQSTTMTATVPGAMNVLARRIVAYPAGMNNRASFTAVKAETVMKTLVTYNTDNTFALTNRDTWGGFNDIVIAVATDQARGSTITRACSRKNLLTELQHIGEIGNLSFDLVRTGPRQLTFEVYPGRRGADRSAEVVFSLDRGNMANPKVDYRPDTAGCVIVGGTGEGEDRQIVLLNGGIDWLGETFVDGRNESSTAALWDRAREVARAGDERDVLSFDVLQTSVSYYGKHYGLGDLVTATYEGLSQVQEIVGISVSVKDGAENIEVETE